MSYHDEDRALTSENASCTKRREVRILHIYSDAMDLYGDYFNLACVKRALEQRFDLHVVIDTVGIDGWIKTAGYSLIYIGHGKARNLQAVSRHFIQYSDEIISAVESGVPFLVTGSARLLFGREFYSADTGEVIGTGIGLFDYTGYDTGKVFTSDVVGRVLDSDGRESDFLTYGFINRTHCISHNGENPHPLFKLLVGKGDDDASEEFEGTRYRNFFGTWQMGPLLARNPDMLEVLLERILGDDYRAPDDETIRLEREALNLTLKEFKQLKGSI